MRRVHARRHAALAERLTKAVDEYVRAQPGRTRRDVARQASMPATVLSELLSRSRPRGLDVFDVFRLCKVLGLPFEETVDQVFYAIPRERREKGLRTGGRQRRTKAEAMALAEAKRAMQASATEP